MRNLPALVAIALTLTLAACSSGPTVDVEAWEPPGTDYSPIACGELLPEWGTGEEEAPAACWTYGETTGLPDRFAGLAESMTDHAGTDPVRGPGCMSTLTCQAEWESAEGRVALASGVSLVGLQAQVEAGATANPADAQLYELLLWISDDQVLSDAEWDQYYEPLEP